MIDLEITKTVLLAYLMGGCIYKHLLFRQAVSLEIQILLLCEGKHLERGVYLIDKQLAWTFKIFLPKHY